MEDEDDIKDFVNEKSKFKNVLLAEKCIEELNEKSFVQFERRGYYVVDTKSKDNDFVLNYIPDGKSSSCSVIKKKVPPKPVVIIEKKSKKQEKKEDKKEDKKDETRDKKDKKEKSTVNENTEDKK